MSATLKLFVDPAFPLLVEKYKTHIDKHNADVLGSLFPNSGFDLFLSDTVATFNSSDSTFMNMHVKAEMVEPNGNTCAYYIFPRSSISKTPLILANHTGIIDSGYRGFLIGAFRSFSVFSTQPFDRLLQICHPSLCPILVELVHESALSSTERGEGGFGSTGR